MRVIGGGKHASIGLSLEGDSTLLEPVNRVSGLPAVEGRAELTGASGIVGYEFFGVEAGVGHVATSAPGDAHFFETLPALFENKNCRCWVGLGRRDGSEKSGCAPANNRQSFHLELDRGASLRRLDLVVVGSGGLVQAAFPFEPAKAGLFFAHTFSQLFCAVPVADGNVALIPERMVGQVVLLQVVIDLPIAPVEDGIDLPNLVLLFEEGPFLPRTGLLPTQTGEPCGGPELGDRTVHRLDFIHLVVALQTVQSLFPEPPMEGFQMGRREVGTIDFEIDLEPISEGLGEAVGLGEEVAGIDEDNGNIGCCRGDQMEHDGALHPEAGGEYKGVAVLTKGPAYPVLRRESGQIGGRHRCRAFCR